MCGPLLEHTGDMSGVKEMLIKLKSKLLNIWSVQCCIYIVQCFYNLYQHHAFFASSLQLSQKKIHH